MEPRSQVARHVNRFWLVLKTSGPSYRGTAEIHSKTFDWVPWNGGDMYDVHPFSHEFDLTPCYMFAWDILY